MTIPASRIRYLAKNVMSASANSSILIKPTAVNISVCDWAASNPELWGNEFGGEMLKTSGHRAYGLTAETSTLEAVQAHLELVAQRLENNEA